MTKVSAAIVATASGGSYTQSNECVGLLKSLILDNVSNATLISDNDPAITVARVVYIQIGDSLHYVKIYSVSASYYSVTIRNVANTSELLYTANWGPTSVTNFTLMYSSTGVYLGITTVLYVAFSKMTDGHWTSHTGSNCYLYNLDTLYTNKPATYSANYLRTDGKEYIIPIKMATGASQYYADADYDSCLYSFNNAKSLSSNQLLDDGGTLWQRISSGTFIMR